MKLLLALLAISLPLSSATLLRVACGSLGGTDPAGNVWTADASLVVGASTTWVNAPAVGLSVPYLNLRYATSFAYSLTVAPGNYRVTLKLIEPNKTGPGQRVFSVTGNGTPMATSLDLYATAGGALKPYDVTATVAAPTGNIRIQITASLGNAVISGIQVDDIPATPPPPGPTASGNIVCTTGTVKSSDLTVTTQQDIPIIQGVSGSFRFNNVLIQESSQFTTSSAVKVSMGTAGVGNDLLLPLALGSTSNQNYTYDTPRPPVVGIGTYDIVLRFTGATALLPAGTVAWEVCGFVTTGAVPLLKQLANLETCSGSAKGWNCAGFMRVTLNDGTVLMATAPSQSTPPGTWTSFIP